MSIYDQIIAENEQAAESHFRLYRCRSLKAMLNTIDDYLSRLPDRHEFDARQPTEAEQSRPDGSHAKRGP